MGRMKLRPQKNGGGKDMNFILGMIKAGKLAGRVLAHVCTFAKAGVTTLELDKIAHDFTLSNGGTNACLGYRGYPNTICTSVNGVMCHGVPDAVPLKAGDIVNIDVTVKVGPFHGDTSRTVFIAPVTDGKVHRIVNAAYGAQQAGMAAVRPMGRTGDIGFATESYIKKMYPELHVVKDIGGHGIGRIFHDKPFIPAFGNIGTGELIRPWTCLTVEPIVSECPEHRETVIQPLEGHTHCEITVATAQWGLAAQFEHTVLVTDTGYEILTLG